MTLNMYRHLVRREGSGCAIRGTSKTVKRGIMLRSVTVFTVQALRSISAVDRYGGKSVREEIDYGTEVELEASGYTWHPTSMATSGRRA